MVRVKVRAVLYVLAVGGYTSLVGSPERHHAAADRDDARLWRVDILGGLELLRPRFGEFTFPPHAHKEVMIALTERGLALPTYRGGSHLVGPGDVLVLNS